MAPISQEFGAYVSLTAGDHFMSTYFCYDDEHLSTNIWKYTQIPHKYLYTEFTGIQEENSGLSITQKKNASVKKILVRCELLCLFYTA